MQHHTIQYIAAILVHSRIFTRRELYRYPKGHHCAIITRDHADTCRHRCDRHSILTPKLNSMVIEKLTLGWCPEMVGYAVHCVPHTIYHWIYQSQVTIRRLQSAIGYWFTFATPTAPMNGGTNERLNRELHYYFPKETKFYQVSEADTQRATELINNKPKKCLQWQAVSKLLSSW